MNNKIKVALLKLVAGLLFLTVLFSVLIWFVSSSLLPLTISAIVFTSFAIFARIKYGLKIVELTDSVYMKKRNDFIDECYSEEMRILTEPGYSSIPANIHHNRD